MEHVQEVRQLLTKGIANVRMRVRVRLMSRVRPGLGKGQAWQRTGKRRPLKTGKPVVKVTYDLADLKAGAAAGVAVSTQRHTAVIAAEGGKLATQVDQHGRELVGHAIPGVGLLNVNHKRQNLAHTPLSTPTPLG